MVTSAQKRRLMVLAQEWACPRSILEPVPGVWFAQIERCELTPSRALRRGSRDANPINPLRSPSGVRFLTGFASSRPSSPSCVSPQKLTHGSWAVLSSSGKKRRSTKGHIAAPRCRRTEGRAVGGQHRLHRQHLHLGRSWRSSSLAWPGFAPEPRCYSGAWRGGEDAEGEGFTQVSSPHWP